MFTHRRVFFFYAGRISDDIKFDFCDMYHSFRKFDVGYPTRVKIYTSMCIRRHVKLRGGPVFFVTSFGLFCRMVVFMVHVSHYWKFEVWMSRRIAVFFD